MELIINFLWSLPNASMESSERLNLGRMLQNTKFNLRIKSYFSVKARQTLEFWEALCLYWIYLKTYFVVIQKPKANLMRDWIFVNWSRMLSQRTQNHFYWKSTQTLRSLKTLKSFNSYRTICKTFEWFNILKQGSKMSNLLKEYKNTTLGTFQKMFFHM